MPNGAAARSPFVARPFWPVSLPRRLLTGVPAPSPLGGVPVAFSVPSLPVPFPRFSRAVALTPRLPIFLHGPFRAPLRRFSGAAALECPPIGFPMPHSPPPFLPVSLHGGSQSPSRQFPCALPSPRHPLIAFPALRRGVCSRHFPRAIALGSPPAAFLYRRFRPPYKVSRATPPGCSLASFPVPWSLASLPPISPCRGHRPPSCRFLCAGTLGPPAPSTSPCCCDRLSP